MNMTFALVLTIVGIVLLLIGLDAADAIQNAFSRLFSGHLTDHTVWLTVGGIICVIIGLVHRSISPRNLSGIALSGELSS